MHLRTIVFASAMLVVSVVRAQFRHLPDGNNIVAAGATKTYLGWGATLSYERFLDSKSVMSFCFPVSVIHGMEYGYPVDHISFLPGLRFYATGSHSRVSYWIGPSVALTVFGQREDVDLAMMMFSNGLGVRLSPKVVLSGEFGIGSTVLVLFGDAYYVLQYHGALKVGFRF